MTLPLSTDTTLAESPAFTITGEKYGVVVARDLGGLQLASAYNGRDGWAVTNIRGRQVHQICVQSYDDAMAVLEVVAREVVTHG